MGAEVVPTTGVEYRFACTECEEKGFLHKDVDEAQADGMAHELSWHYRKGDVIQQGEQFAWWCRDCDTSTEFTHAAETAAADGWQHELMWHKRVYVVDQVGTYDD